VRERECRLEAASAAGRYLQRPRRQYRCK
jgi:hypothetical protein